MAGKKIRFAPSRSEKKRRTFGFCDLKKWLTMASLVRSSCATPPSAPFPEKVMCLKT